mgnify:CR=1 FL=1
MCQDKVMVNNSTGQNETGRAIYTAARERAARLNIYDIGLALRSANGESRQAYLDELAAKTEKARIWRSEMVARERATGEQT